MSIRFEREALYQEVWSQPLTKLGKKYGLSDNGVRKICIALNIPLPKAGHWARIAAGHKIPKKPLPKHSEITVYVSNPKPPEPFSQEKIDDAIWLKQHAAFETDSNNQIVVELQPNKFHPRLVETRKDLIEKVKIAESLISKAQTKSNTPKSKGWESNIYLSGMNWNMFNNNGQLLDLHRWGMPFRFTPKTWERGLAIANALFFEAESRGFKIVKEKESNQLGFKLHDGVVYIRMSERLRREEREVTDTLSKLEVMLGASHIYAPTGILRFHFCASGGSSEVEVPDTDATMLEENLNQVFCKIYKLIVKSRSNERAMAERQRKYIEERRLDEERQKVRQEELRLQQIESQKRKDLLQDATNWQTAELIYKFIAHFDEIEDIQENVQFIAWKNWALNTANELDPTSASLKRIMGN